MHTTLHDNVGIHFGGSTRERQRITNEISNAMVNLGRLIVVRQQNCVLLTLQFINFCDIRRVHGPLDIRNDVF